MSALAPSTVRQRRAFARAAESFSQHDGVIREIEGRLLEHLDPVRIEPSWILDMGSGPGRMRPALQRRYAQARYLAADAVLPMLQVQRRRWPWQTPPRRIAADLRRLPLGDQSLDLAVANLSLSALADLPDVLREAARCLRPGGLLALSILGPDSLVELREAWGLLGEEQAVPAFHDMHDVGDLLAAAGLAGVVMDCERLTITYADPAGLFEEMRALGVSGYSRYIRRGLHTRALQQRLSALLPRQPDGRAAITLEVVYGHAWASAPRRSHPVELRLP